MKNADMRAQPFQEVTGMVNGVPTGYKNHKGLTKREMFAMHAMQGLITCVTDSGYTTEQLCRDAVSAADALLEELEK